MVRKLREMGLRMKSLRGTDDGFSLAHVTVRCEIDFRVCKMKGRH